MAKPNLPFSLQAMSPENPHAAPLEELTSVQEEEDPLAPSTCLAEGTGQEKAPAEVSHLRARGGLHLLYSALIIGSHGTSKPFSEFSILQASQVI